MVAADFNRFLQYAPKVKIIDSPHQGPYPGTRYICLGPDVRKAIGEFFQDKAVFPNLTILRYDYMGLPTDEPIPPMPRPARQVATISIDDASTGPPETKRKAPDEDGDVEMPADSSTEVSKRAKTDNAPPPTGVSNPSSDEAMLAHAKRTAAYIPILSPEILLPPKLPTREEMEAYLLELRKKALVEEYFGDEQ